MHQIFDIAVCNIYCEILLSKQVKVFATKMEKKMQTALSTVRAIFRYMYASCFVWNIYAFGFLINDWI